MSGRGRKELRCSKQISDQGSRPPSARGNGRNTPDRYYTSQPPVDPGFSDLSIAGPPFSGQPTLYQQRTAGPDRRPRSPVPQHNPYTSSSGQRTPNRHHITDQYGGQAITQATSGGHPGLYSSSQLAVHTHFGGQPITDSRYSRQPTPNQQGISDLYGGQAIPQVTSGGHPSPYSSGQLAVHPPFGDQPITNSRYSRPPTPNQQRSTDTYGGQRFPAPQLTPYPSSIGQAPPNQQPIPGLYGSQPIFEASSGGHLGSYSSSHPPVDPHFHVQTALDPRPIGPSTANPQHIETYPGGWRTPHSRFGEQTTYDPRTSGQSTLNDQRVTDPYGAGQRTLQPNSSGQSINNGIYTITNIYQKRFVYLEDSNDRTPLRGHFNQENRAARWHVIQRVDGEYSIKNVDHGLYASCGSRARLDAFVEGHSEEQIWCIRERYRGQYTIAAIDSGNFWMLPDKEKDTPVTFSRVPTDPMCLWSFESAEIVAPVNENPVAQPVMPYTELLLAASGSQPMPDAAIVEFTSMIAGASDLLPPLRAACEALRVVLQREESIDFVSEGQIVLIKRLKFHLATIENDIAKLKEDQEIDETIPALNQALRESLENYAKELKEIHELLLVNQPKESSLVDEVTRRTLKIDEVFQIYTTALHRFAASTVDQMRQQLSRFQQESQKSPTLAEKERLIHSNAYGIQHRECLRGTREKTLLAISNWAANENTEKWIFFFLDVAGSGKSTVAKHMAEKWNRENQLLARFFFSRDTTETMSTNSFCSTVAGAFSVLDPTYKDHVDKFMKLPNVGLLSFEELFEGLVVRPLTAIGRHAILIIDALDECDLRQREQLLQTLRAQHSSIPFLRIFATGRPEGDIKRWANDEFGFGYKNFILLEKNDKDVELYIKHALKDIPIAQDRLYPVIRRAEGLFIWARIACDLLLDSDDIDGLLDELGKEVSLDYLYKVALEQSMPKEGASRRAMVLVLQMILAAKEPLSIAELEMLSSKPGVVERIVTRLGSVLLYQGREDPIRLLHATFREFLTTRSKANIFFVQPELGHHTLASGCLTIISDRSKQDNSSLQQLDAISQRKAISFGQDTY